jgi:hypothetical protein
MAQHARPIGPTTANPAAAFSPEMAQGSLPSRSPIRAAWRPPPVGWIDGRTTQVDAPFAPNMIAADRPVQSRASRPFTAPSERDWQVQPPEVPVFSIEMVRGARPDSPRLFLPLRTGQQLTSSPQLAAAFSIEMVLADRPQQSRVARGGLLPPERDAQILPPEVTDFSVDQAVGSHPDSPRLFVVRPHVGWTVSEHTPIAAPFSIEMLQADRPSTPRVPRPWLPPSERDCQVMPPDVLAFSVEQAQGSHPDSPRLFTILAHLGGAVGPLTPVAAPFSADMVTGSVPDRNRERLPLRTGTALWISDIVILSPEMTIGSRPDNPRLPRAPQSPIALAPDVLAFSIEMVQGTHPESPRLVRPRAAVVTVPPDVLGFSIEMVIGAHPDRGRLFLPLRTGLADASSAPHVAAPFGVEMVVGWTPHASRQGLPLRYLQGPTWYWPTDAAPVLGEREEFTLFLKRTETWSMFIRQRESWPTER